MPAVPGADPLSAFAAAPAGSRRFCWIQPERGLAIAGIGAALQWQPAGRRGRFSEAARFVSEVSRDLQGVAEVTAPGTGPSGPLLCGGFAFDSQPGGEQSRWAGFGAGMLVLPELLGIAEGGELRWLVVASADRLAEASQRAVQLLRVAAEAVRAPTPLVLLGPGGAADDGYLATIDAALAQIRAGALSKVVPGRVVTVRLAGSPGDAAAVGAVAAAGSPLPHRNQLRGGLRGPDPAGSHPRVAGQDR